MPKKLKVVVIGYYGKLNAGDDLLQNAMTQIFQDHDLMFTSWFPGIDLLNLADLVVVGGGSIWPGNTVFQHGSELARKLTTPLVVLGISARNSDIKIKEQTQGLINRSHYFHVRDKQSSIKIGGDLANKIVCGTDLYWWIDHDVGLSPATDTNTVSLNLRDFDESDWDPKQLHQVVADEFTNIRPFPFYFGSPSHEANGAKTDRQILIDLGIEHVPNSFSHECLNTSAVTIGMRFHSLMLSIRAGVPIIGFDYHNKTRNLFESNQMSELCCSLEDPESLRRAIQTLRDNYPSYQAKIRQIRDSYLQDAVSDRERFAEVLRTIEPAPPPTTTQKIKRRLAKLLP